MKKLFIATTIIALALQFSACSKKTKTEDGDQAQSTDTGNAVEMTEGSPKTDEAQAGFVDTQLPEDPLGKPQDQAASSGSTSQAGVEALPTLDLGSAEKPVPIPLLKVKDAAYREGDQIINAFYIARPNDNFKKISELIFDTTKNIKDLKAANPGLKVIQVGSKVYYNSPKRPTDETKLMNYYEDMGMVPELYIAKEGDNIKKIAQSLLGFKQAWKEVWSINTVESKGKLTAGTELRYWKGNQTDLGKVASNNPTDTTAFGGTAPTQPSNDLPPPPVDNFPPPPVDNFPPPPQPTNMQARGNELPPPPPPSDQFNPPPPPPPMQIAQQKKKGASSKAKGSSDLDMLDEDTMMMVAAGAIGAVAIAVLMMIKKRKSRQAEVSQFETNVGS